MFVSTLYIPIFDRGLKVRLFWFATVRATARRVHAKSARETYTKAIGNLADITEMTVYLLLSASLIYVSMRVSSEARQGE
jgi:hypothetical protein